jgi:hypothetical protein
LCPPQGYGTFPCLDLHGWMYSAHYAQVCTHLTGDGVSKGPAGYKDRSVTTIMNFGNINEDDFLPFFLRPLSPNLDRYKKCVAVQTGSPGDQ